MTLWDLWVFVASAVLTAVLTAGVRPYLAHLNVVDVPNGRSSHVTTTLRGGGLSPLAIVVGVALVVALVPASPFPGDLPTFAALAGILALGTLGWVEDRRGLPVRVRLAAQVVVGAAVAAVLVVDGAGIPAAVVIAGSVPFIVNTTNFMDGVNGISASHGVAWGAYFCVVGSASNTSGLALLAVCGAGAFLGFLPWNFPRPRLFLGDVGSYTLGGLLWALMALAVLAGVNPVVAVAPFAPYAADVVLTVLRRARRGENIAEAHREHAYQVIHQRAGSHAVATISVLAATVATSVSGLLLFYGVLGTWTVLSLVVLVAAVYGLLPHRGVALIRRHA